MSFMYIRALALSVVAFFLTPAARGAGAWPSFAEWETACSRLVRNRDLKTESPLPSTLPLGSFDDFERAMGPFLQNCLTGQLSQASAWLGAPASSDFYNLGRAHFFNPPAAFEPYVQRLQVPARSEILFHADLHGGILRMGSTPSNRLRAVFRGHQHASTLNPMMTRLLASRGLFRHWQEGDSTNALAWTVSGLSRRLEIQAEQAVPDGSVWTLNVAPDSVYGLRCGYDFDVLARLTVQEDFSLWRLRRITLLPEGSGFREE